MINKINNHIRNQIKSNQINSNQINSNQNKTKQFNSIQFNLNNLKQWEAFSPIIGPGWQIVIGEPASGKTTILQDMAKTYGERHSVSVIIFGERNSERKSWEQIPGINLYFISPLEDINIQMQELERALIEAPQKGEVVIIDSLYRIYNELKNKKTGEEKNFDSAMARELAIYCQLVSETNLIITSIIKDRGEAELFSTVMDGYCDAVLSLSRNLAMLGLFPAINPQKSMARRNPPMPPEISGALNYLRGLTPSEYVLGWSTKRGNPIHLDKYFKY